MGFSTIECYGNISVTIFRDTYENKKLKIHISDVSNPIKIINTTKRNAIFSILDRPDPLIDTLSRWRGPGTRRILSKHHFNGAYN